MTVLSSQDPKPSLLSRLDANIDTVQRMWFQFATLHNIIALLVHRTFTTRLQVVIYSGYDQLGHHRFSLKWPSHCGEHF